MKKTKTARMHNPPHPGEVLRDTILSVLSGSEFARHLGVSRFAFSRVVNGRTAVSADMALRLSGALGGSAESWLWMQASYDLWQASRKPRPKIALVKLARSPGRSQRSST